jgi:hypothetical protein
MRADARWAEAFPGRVLWDAYPFKTYNELFPDAPTWLNNPALRHQASNPPPRDACTPDEDEIAILRDHYPDCDIADPPWSQIETELLAAGVAPATIRELNTKKLIRLFGRIADPKPPDADGPCGMHQWRHNRAVSESRMQSKPWHLASFLFERLGSRVTYDDVTGPGRIFEDAIQPASIQRHCSYISTWFSTQTPAIPIEIATDRFGMVMTESRMEG